MNPYDAARNLADSIKKSDEYINFKNSKDKVYSIESSKKMLDDLQEKVMELQMMSMQGTEVSDEQIENVQKLQEVAIQDENIKDYFEKEVRLEQLMNDVSKIISEVVEL